jgi:hypothetical protein
LGSVEDEDSPLLEKREKWGTPVSHWSELKDEPHINRTLGEGGHPPSAHGNRFAETLQYLAAGLR